MTTKTITSNCRCTNCGKEIKQPLKVWYRLDSKTKLHYKPACSMECAKELAEKL